MVVVVAWHGIQLCTSLFTTRAAAGAATGDSDKWHMFHQRHDMVAGGACG